jgi:DUF971 family protein
MGLLDRIALTKHDADPPEAIDVLDGARIRILWPGGREVTLPSVRLRDCCPCAGCIDEASGKKILDPATIPADIHPVQILPVGSYAIQFHWSDGHSTGLYTWQTLRDACGLGGERP